MFVYLLESLSFRDGERDRLPTGSLLRWLQWPELDQAKPGARSSTKSPTRGIGAQTVGPPEVASEAEHRGHKLASMWNANIEDGDFTCHAQEALLSVHKNAYNEKMMHGFQKFFCTKNNCIFPFVFFPWTSYTWRQALAQPLPVSLCGGWWIPETSFLLSSPREQLGMLPLSYAFPSQHMSPFPSTAARELMSSVMLPPSKHGLAREAPRAAVRRPGPGQVLTWPSATLPVLISKLRECSTENKHEGGRKSRQVSLDPLPWASRYFSSLLLPD